jgi:hypothetical protein
MTQQSSGGWPHNEVLKCGVSASEHGPVVGCCHVCGLLLCEQHLFHNLGSARFGRVEGKGAMPLVCGVHRAASARPGLPRSDTATAPRDNRVLGIFRPRSSRRRRRQ